MDDVRRPCGASLSMPHAYALLELLAHGAPMSVSGLAAKLSIDRTNVSRLCVRMEAAGELVRERDPRDARARSLRLTPSGEALARDVDESSARRFADVLDRLGGDLGTTEALVRLQEAMEKDR